MESLIVTRCRPQVTWRVEAWGGSTDGVDLSNGVQSIAANDKAMCALLIGGGVACWGDSSHGARSFSSEVETALASGVSDIYAPGKNGRDIDELNRINAHFVANKRLS